MRIALIGYGKMGKTIELLALEAGHEIVCKIDHGDPLENLLNQSQDIAIEFSQPDAAYENLSFCIEHGIAVISGTTGWLEHYQELVLKCKSRNGTFLYASNFSVGVNLFFELNKWLADKMASLSYEVSMKEVHHTEKKDSPSGTAITLAEGIISTPNKYDGWVNETPEDKRKLPIISERIAKTPGTHIVTYSSEMETISIEHVAKDRKIFAAGVIKVSEWIHTRKGVFTMSDFLNS